MLTVPPVRDAPDLVAHPAQALCAIAEGSDHDRVLPCRWCAGETFVLQGGDCAESFEDCDPAPITAKLKILLQMSLVLEHATRKPVVRIGRIAGQYAKPRSNDQETRNGLTLPTYRGDLVNRSGFTREDRSPDPELMLRGYERAALTLNFLRALSSAGFADLHEARYWDLDFAKHAEYRDEYARMVQTIRDSLQLTQASSDTPLNGMSRVGMYTSHEGLALAYEQAQTREVPRRAGWYNLSTHFPWIGMRTAQLEGAHVEYFRGIRNPIAVKVGPGMSESWLCGLIEVLDPADEPGRLTLIHRFGAGRIGDCLPPLIDAARKTRKTVTWLVDPMHGNTEKTRGGLKTRRFDKILSEVEQAFQIHTACGSVLGGMHFELTGDHVTECVGGSCGLSEHELRPRLPQQSRPAPKWRASTGNGHALRTGPAAEEASEETLSRRNGSRASPRRASPREVAGAPEASGASLTAATIAGRQPRDAKRLAGRRGSPVRHRTS